MYEGGRRDSFLKGFFLKGSFLKGYCRTAFENPSESLMKCIFRYDFDGVFEATPGCRRAVQEAVLALQKNGHQVLPFCPPHLPTAMKVNSLYRAGDLGATNKAQLSIGPVSTQSLGLRRLQHRLPATLRTTIATGMLPGVQASFGQEFSKTSHESRKKV